MGSKAQGEAVKAASNLVFQAIAILSGSDIDRASFNLGETSIALHISGDEDGFVFRFSAQKIVIGDDPEGGEKLPGMTPSRALDKGDLS